jgi:hypothetical protein
MNFGVRRLVGAFPFKTKAVTSHRTPKALPVIRVPSWIPTAIEDNPLLPALCAGR